jgi:hypothetical protein
MAIIKIEGRHLLNKVLDMPPVNAMYFTNSKEELSDMICSLRWSLVFKIKSSLIGEILLDKLGRAKSIIQQDRDGIRTIERKAGDSLITKNSNILLNFLVQLLEMLIQDFDNTDPDKDLTVIIPFIVCKGKPIGLFDWYYEKLSVEYISINPPRKSDGSFMCVGVVNKATHRNVGARQAYVLDISDSSNTTSNPYINSSSKLYEKVQNLAVSLGLPKSHLLGSALPGSEHWFMPGVKVVPTSLVPQDWSDNRSLRLVPSNTSNSSASKIFKATTELGHAFIQPEDVTIYNNDFMGNIQATDPCSNCPNMVRRLSGNCYFMTNQCKALSLGNIKDSSSWTSKSKK